MTMDPERMDGGPDGLDRPTMEAMPISEPPADLVPLSDLPAETAPTPEPVARTSRRLDRRIVGPFTVRQLLAIAIVLNVAGLLLSALSTPIGPTSSADGPRPGASFVVVGERAGELVVGAPAPELEGTRDGATVPLMDLDGEPIRLADLRGRLVWVNFWASWCPPCQEETPVLRTMDARYRDSGLSIVGISVQETSVDDVRAYAQTYGLDYRIGFDTGSEIFRAWKGFGLPTQVFVAPDGTVALIHYGPLTLPQAESLVVQLLPSPSPGASPTA
jgi:hypothetical protein